MKTNLVGLIFINKVSFLANEKVIDSFIILGVIIIVFCLLVLMFLE